MRTIVHISDLHFGRIDPAIPPALKSAIEAARPDLIVISGDLTQRAKNREFTEARAFLDTLPASQIVVPGNHDVPLYNVFARWLRPRAGFERYFGSESQPTFVDNEIAVVGINTARSFTVKNGRISRDQVVRACAKLTSAVQNAVRIVVTHHPFALEDVTSHELVGRAQMAMEAFSACRVDIILSGHVHTSHTIASTERYRTLSGRSTLLVQAGTATSTRRRGEENAFNILNVDRERLAITRMSWRGNSASPAFRPRTVEEFERRDNGWNVLERPPPASASPA